MYACKMGKKAWLGGQIPGIGDQASHTVLSRAFPQALDRYRTSAVKEGLEWHCPDSSLQRFNTSFQVCAW